MEKEISLPEAQMEVMEVIWDERRKGHVRRSGEELAAGESLGSPIPF